LHSKDGKIKGENTKKGRVREEPYARNQMVRWMPRNPKRKGVHLTRNFIGKGKREKKGKRFFKRLVFVKRKNQPGSRLKLLRVSDRWVREKHRYVR